MTSTATRLLKLSLSALHYSGAARLLAPLARGEGAILMLHHVVPDPPRAFEPNGILKVTPQFLEAAIVEVRRQGFDIVSLDEAAARLAAPPRSGRPFACVTFDDGYRDNRDHAYPVLRRHGVPFTIYVATEFADGTGFLWWLVLEEAIRRSVSVRANLGDAPLEIACRSDAEKRAAFEHIYWRLRAMPEDAAREVVGEIARAAGIEPQAPCRDLVMGWDELGSLAADPLVTIGAHTVSHRALARLTAAQARAEITDSVARIERELARPCRHFSFPYGDAGSAGAREFAICDEIGLATAVTTAKGFIGRRHAGLRTGLPRVSLNGDYQRAAYLEALLSGVPFLLWNALPRPAAARQV